MATKAIATQNVLQAIANQSHGFRFGEIQKLEESSLSIVLPLLRETSTKRQYITLPETEEVIISDSGGISRMNVENKTHDNVFLRSGTIFQGKTQERTLTRSAIIFPGQSVALEVRCVHASEPIRGNSVVRYKGVTPLHMDQACYFAGYKMADQSQTWSSVQASTVNMRSLAAAAGPTGRAFRMPGVRGPRPARRPSPRPYQTPRNPWEERLGDLGGAVEDVVGYTEQKHDDLASNLDAFAKTFDGVLAKVKPQQHQVGLALITDKGCQTLEAFDVPVSWTALHQDAIRRIGTDLLKKDEKRVFAYKPENAIDEVRGVLALNFTTNRIYEHKPSNGEPSVLISGLTAKGYVGEVVEVDNRVMHLVLLKTAAA